MPAFNTHWMVAILCRNFASQAIKDGFNAYKNAVDALRGSLISQFELISNSTTKKDSKAAYIAFIKGGADGIFNLTINKFENDLKRPAIYDDVTCFSAYMLGACGPDLWTVLGPGFKTAGIHFDMGHYNRSAHQFKVAIQRWKEKTKSDKKYTDSLQYKVESSYFLGMATHIAADVVIHQLVNVYAGAYNLLESKWESEHGFLSCLKNLWNTHNKVEHFWDSYIRYRYLGDYSYIYYFVCPNLERTKEYGLNVFYHLDALKPFVASAFKVAERFLNGLNRAINKGDELITYLFLLLTGFSTCQKYGGVLNERYTVGLKVPKSALDSGLIP